MAREPKIAIVFETFQDFQIIRRHIARLSEWGVPYQITQASALRSPERLARWIVEQEKAGIEVFIAAAGGAAGLAGAVAAKTDRLVIGVPLDTTHFRGQDALTAMMGLPGGLPVAAVGINNVENALYCALRVLALHDPEYASLLQGLHAQLAAKENDSLENIRQQYPECFPQAQGPGPAVERSAVGKSDLTAESDQVVPMESEVSLKEVPRPVEPVVQVSGDLGETALAQEHNSPSTSPAIATPRKVKCIAVSTECPDVGAIEEVVDILLDGGVVALPTDTVYGLAAVATNSAAVQRLYQIKGREKDKPIPLLIHSTRGLSHLVRDVPEAARGLIEQLWPGALTLVFRKHRSSFAEVSSGETIGIRMPDHTVTLAVISMLARPLAVTSANLSGCAPALTAAEALESFGDRIDCVLDAGRTPGEKVSTVLSVAESPFRVLREGAISLAQIKAIVADALADL
ncbi:threonylcarbamoyl-AMP synthase [Candidatus Sumerlaeota bacterium]|nr:threonylcarbamoyl-AMP synthase [Candidatus Sumerlaeota bacterium]